ncbi:hypothetical protein Syun_017215 [Stephania yunnanensis]|uniref:Exocyst subunit Exo70 family protein n=1 Tax=Stephania yunnanensis TaxID=152371 RepID=A0AAP0J8S2_9MAGN
MFLKQRDSPHKDNHNQKSSAGEEAASASTLDHVSGGTPTASPRVERKLEEQDLVAMAEEMTILEQDDKGRERVDESGETLESDHDLGKLSEEVDQFLGSVGNLEDKPSQIEIPSCVEKFAKLVELEIAKFDSGDAPAKWCHEIEEGFSVLHYVERISKLTNAFREFHQSEMVNKTTIVLQRAMMFFEDEFRAILEDYKSPNSESIDINNAVNAKGKQSQHLQQLNEEHDQCETQLQQPDQASSEEDQFPGYVPETVSKLKQIATSMIFCGYEAECCQAYSLIRRHALHDSLRKLGCEKMSIDDVQKMQWESLEGEVAKWIIASKHCFKIYLPGELKLCNEIFLENPSASASLFGNFTRSILIQLLNFAEAVAMTKRSTEKLFKFLDIYETLRDLIGSIGGFLSDEELTHELMSEITTARSRIAEAVIGIFSDLENSIKTDTGKTPVPGGAVHPLTRYIMNYVKYACEYKDTLEQVFHEHQKIDQADASRLESDNETETSQQAQHHQHDHHHRGGDDHNQSTKPSPFSFQLMTVMGLLDANLESKSKLYKELSLSYIFLMNNGRYIVQKIKSSPEIHDLMGDTWCRRRSSDLRQYHKNYQRETWGKVLGCLKDDGLIVHGKIVKPLLKERFKSFNATFEEIHKTQSSWVVSDEQLQSELRVSISAVMTPAYRSFLARFSQYLDAGRQTEKYIKFGPEDIESYIDDLFDGNPSSIIRRRT